MKMCFQLLAFKIIQFLISQNLIKNNKKLKINTLNPYAWHHLRASTCPLNSFSLMSGLK
jgi:hypothetical protein